MVPPKIGIIGASLVGMACAILLARAGFQVKVFEQRKEGGADDRGVGLALPCDLVEELKEKGLFDPDFVPLLINHRELYAYDKVADQERLLTSHSTHINAMNWGGMYQQLKKRLPSSLIHYEYKLMKVQRQQDSVRLYFNNNCAFEFDFAIFADGSQSLGRSFLFPKTQPEFAGYIAWRTSFVLKNDEEIQPLMMRQPIYGYPCGIGFAYLIPSRSKGEHAVNCLIYEKITAHHALFKNDWKKADQNIPASLLPPSYLEYYQNLVKSEFPPYARNLFLKGSPFIQSIRDTLIDSYYRNRIALVGDASTLLRPVTGSGATKGLQDALALEKQLKEVSSIDQAFTSWGNARAKAAKHLYELGKALSDFYVMDPPDWARAESEEIQRRWDSITQNVDWYITKNAPVDKMRD